MSGTGRGLARPARTGWIVRVVGIIMTERGFGTETNFGPFATSAQAHDFQVAHRQDWPESAQVSVQPLLTAPFSVPSEADQ